MIKHLLLALLCATISFAISYPAHLSITRNNSISINKLLAARNPFALAAFPERIIPDPAGLADYNNLPRRTIEACATPNYSVCEDGDLCCPADGECCYNGGCAVAGGECCSVGIGSCDPGFACCQSGCILEGEQCCATGNSCPSGTHCYVVEGTQQCCTDPSCDETSRSNGVSSEGSTISASSTPTSTPRNSAAIYSQSSPEPSFTSKKKIEVTPSGKDSSGSTSYSQHSPTIHGLVPQASSSSLGIGGSANRGDSGKPIVTTAIVTSAPTKIDSSIGETSATVIAEAAAASQKTVSFAEVLGVVMAVVFGVI